MFPFSPPLSSEALKKVLCTLEAGFRGGNAGVVLCGCISVQQASNKSNWRDTAKDKEEQRWRLTGRSHWERREGFAEKGLQI